MNPHLETAIIQFLADEFHMDPEDFLPDTDFFAELDLDENQFMDLIARMQDALDFVLPEEKISDIRTLSDLYHTLTAGESTPHESI